MKKTTRTKIRHNTTNERLTQTNDHHNHEAIKTKILQTKNDKTTNDNIQMTRHPERSEAKTKNLKIIKTTQIIKQEKKLTQTMIIAQHDLHERKQQDLLKHPKILPLHRFFLISSIISTKTVNHKPHQILTTPSTKPNSNSTMH